MSSFLWAVNSAKKKDDCPWLGRLSKEWNEKRDDAARRNNAGIMRRFEGEYGPADPFVGSRCATGSPPPAPPPTPPLPPDTRDPSDGVVPLDSSPVVPDDDDAGDVFFGDPTPQGVIPLGDELPAASDAPPVVSNPCTFLPSPGYSADDIARDCWVSQHGTARAVSECARGSGGGVKPSWCEGWGLPYGPAAADAAARAEFAARPLEASSSSQLPASYVWSSGETTSGAPAPASKGLPWWAFALGGVALLGVIGASKKPQRGRTRSRRAA